MRQKYGRWKDDGGLVRGKAEERKEYDEDNTQMTNEDMNLEKNALEKPNTKEEHQITALDYAGKNPGHGTK